MTVTLGNSKQSSEMNWSEEQVALFNPTKEFWESAFARFLGTQEDVVTSHIWSFLGIKDVGASRVVSKLWKKTASSNPLWAILHKRVFASENAVPSLIRENGDPLPPEEVERLSEICKERYLKTNALFSDRIGSEFYSEHLGDVKDEPIPVVHIAKAQEVDRLDPEGRLVFRTHREMFVPKEITIKVSAGSKLVVKEGRLIEDLELVSLEERTLIVPTTLNNIAMLMDKCLKKGHATGIHKDSWIEVLKQHGDSPVEKARWVYMKIAVEGLDLTYEAQEKWATDHGYEVSPLIDRVLLNFFTYVRSKAFVDHTNIARTSTPVVDGVSTYLATSWAFGPRLFLNLSFDYVGVALGVPSGSSTAIG